MHMKTRRILSVFLLLILVCSLAAPSALAAQAPAVEVPDPDIQAKAALLVDRNTGTILYAKNEHQQLYPASLTKIMTCLLVLEAVDAGKLKLDQEITAPAAAFSGLDTDGSTAGIKAGEIMTLENLLYCMMVVSANEAANILAVTVGGTVKDFVDLMNAKAKELGCKDTHFANPIGLQDTQHYTSAWDLYLITKEALTHDEFMTVCDTADIVIPATNLAKERHLYSTNYLLSSFRAGGYIDKDAHGIKTGSTSDAGHCLVSTASRGSLSFISVVLGAERIKLPTGVNRVMSFYETSRLFDWGFDNFSYQTALTSEEMLASMPVTLSRDASSVALHAKEDVNILMPSALKPEDLTRTIRFVQKTTEAPVSEGKELAEVELSYNGTIYATVPLVALNDVPASKLLVFRSQVVHFFALPLVRAACVLLGLLVLALIVWKLTVGRRRYRYGKSVRPPRGYRGRRKHF
jgi:D-alanyl-D-alanine carboxypeptidase (penicillin-binding protein 5/6)